MVNFQALSELTKRLTNQIRAINNNDTNLSPKEQANAISRMQGITRQAMSEAVEKSFARPEGKTDKHSTPLAESIRKLLSRGRPRR